MSFGFVFKGDDVIVAHNFDAPEEADAKVRVREDFVYGLIKENGEYFVPFGVNKDGSFGSLFGLKGSSFIQNNYLNGVEISKLVEDYIYEKLDFAQVKDLLKDRPLMDHPKTSLHALLIEKHGKVLILEPGRGIKERDEKFNVMGGYSFFEPMATKFSEDSYYDECLRISDALKESGNDFSVVDALKLLKQHQSIGCRATRISMVYSVRANTVYWCLDGDFDSIHKNRF